LLEDLFSGSSEIEPAANHLAAYRLPELLLRLALRSSALFSATPVTRLDHRLAMALTERSVLKHS